MSDIQLATFWHPGAPLDGQWPGPVPSWWWTKPHSPLHDVPSSGLRVTTQHQKCHKQTESNWRQDMNRIDYNCIDMYWHTVPYCNRNGKSHAETWKLRQCQVSQQHSPAFRARTVEWDPQLKEGQAMATCNRPYAILRISLANSKEHKGTGYHMWISCLAYDLAIWWADCGKAVALTWRMATVRSTSLFRRICGFLGAL